MPICCGLFDSPLLFLHKCSDDWRLQNKPLDDFAKHLSQMVETELVKPCTKIPRFIAPCGQKLPATGATLEHESSTNRIVAFRGFVSDMLNPEFYLAQYRVTNAGKPGNHQFLSGMYTELVKIPDGFELDIDESESATMERYCFCVAPIPGESEWVHTVANPNDGADSCGMDSALAPGGDGAAGVKEADRALKRPIGDISQDRPAASGNTAGDVVAMETSDEGPTDPKRLAGDCPEKVGSSEASEKTTALDTATSSNSTLIAKFYEDPTLKLNDMVELYGIVYPGSSNSDEDELMDSAQSSPAALCFHVLHYRKLVHSNPLLDLHLKPLVELPKMDTVRESLLAYLTETLSGDALAAEYLMLHFISKVHTRRDLLAVGKFSLNFFNLPYSSSFCQNVCGVVQNLISKSKVIPMTLDNLNKSRFVPKKDFTANRLVPGELQLCPGTELILDETKLQVGELQERGLMNLAALKKLVAHQKVDYDFQFHTVEFLTDFNILVTSEGKSMLDCDFSLPMNAASGSEDSFQAPVLSAETLAQFRTFLTVAREADYAIGESMQSVVQQDFVTMRQEERRITGEKLHHLLVLARLLSIAGGGETLTATTWQRAKVLESLRAARIKEAAAELERRRLATLTR